MFDALFGNSDVPRPETGFDPYGKQTAKAAAQPIAPANKPSAPSTPSASGKMGGVFGQMAQRIPQGNAYGFYKNRPELPAPAPMATPPIGGMKPVDQPQGNANTLEDFLMRMHLGDRKLHTLPELNTSPIY